MCEGTCWALGAGEGGGGAGGGQGGLGDANSLVGEDEVICEKCVAEVTEPF